MIPIPRSLRLFVLALVALTVVGAPSAAAQSSGQQAQWHGQKNEFGEIKMIFQDAIVGDEIPVEARVTLFTTYADKRVTYFMFAFTAENQPLCVDWTYLGTEDGDELSPFKQDGSDGDAVQKRFIEDTEMPPLGKTIVLRGTVGASERGLMQLGALVVPFNYKWEKITMANGLPADLFSFTQYGVNKETSGCAASGATGGGNFVGNVTKNLPAPSGFVVVVGLAIVAVAFAGRARRR